MIMKKNISYINIIERFSNQAAFIRSLVSSQRFKLDIYCKNSEIITMLVEQPSA